MMDGTSKKTLWMSDRFLQGTIWVSKRKKHGNGIGDSSQTHKNPTWGTRKVIRSLADGIRRKCQQLERIWLVKQRGAGFDAITSSFGDFTWVNLVNNQTGPDLELKNTLQINFHPYFSGLLVITHQPLQCRHCHAYFVFLLHSQVCLLILAMLLALEAGPVCVSVKSQHQLDRGPEYTNATSQGPERGARQVCGPPGKCLRLLSVYLSWDKASQTYRKTIRRVYLFREVRQNQRTTEPWFRSSGVSLTK